MSTDSKLRQLVNPLRRITPTGPDSEGPADNEAALLDKIEELQGEIDRLNRRLTQDRGGDDAPGADAAPGPSSALQLDDGRVLPVPVTVGGSTADPEPGAPRVPAFAAVAKETPHPNAVGSDRGTSFEFAPDDESASAFDDFMNAPDPQHDKIRGFLLG